MRRVYVVETRRPDRFANSGEWEPRSAHVEKRDALRECGECRDGEGGQWRVQTYEPKGTYWR